MKVTGRARDLAILKCNLAVKTMKFSLMLVVIAACFPQIVAGQDGASAYDVPEAYAVYSTLIEGNTARTLVIRTETGDFPNGGQASEKCLAPAKGEEAVYAPIIAAYRTVNKTKWLLKKKFETESPFELVPLSVFNGFFKGVPGSWAEFYKQYPNSNGITELSAVGFNVDKTIAIVYMGNSCGSLCGFGTYHVLQKKDGKWTKIHGKIQACTWVS